MHVSSPAVLTEHRLVTDGRIDTGPWHTALASTASVEALKPVPFETLCISKQEITQKKPERGREDFWRVQTDDCECAGDSKLSNHAECYSYGN